MRPVSVRPRNSRATSTTAAVSRTNDIASTYPPAKTRVRFAPPYTRCTVSTLSPCSAETSWLNPANSRTTWARARPPATRQRVGEACSETCPPAWGVVATGSVNLAMRSLLERFGVRPLKGLAVPAAADRATSRNTREVFPVSPKPRKVSYGEFGHEAASAPTKSLRISFIGSATKGHVEAEEDLRHRALPNHSYRSQCRRDEDPERLLQRALAALP